MPETLGDLRDLLAGANSDALKELANLPDSTPVACGSVLDVQKAGGGRSKPSISGLT